MLPTQDLRFQSMLIVLEETAKHLDDPDLSKREVEARDKFIRLCGLIYEEMEDTIE